MYANSEDRPCIDWQYEALKNAFLSDMDAMPDCRKAAMSSRAQGSCLSHRVGKRNSKGPVIVLNNLVIDAVQLLGIDSESVWVFPFRLIFNLQGYTRRALRSEIRKPRRSKKMRGIGNSFQPAIVASRFDLMNCDIAPSAKILRRNRCGGYILGNPEG